MQTAYKMMSSYTLSWFWFWSGDTLSLNAQIELIKGRKKIKINKNKMMLNYPTVFTSIAETII